MDDCITIPLSNGMYAIVDADQADKVQRYTWSAQQSSRTWYVKTLSYKNGRHKIYLHRLIMDAKKGEIVDHINRNGLDCRKSNLRIVSSAENGRNSRLPTNNTSGFRGLTYVSDRPKPWHAVVVADYKRHSAGYYATKEEAARGYDRKAHELHGAFAQLNFPEEL